MSTDERPATVMMSPGAAARRRTPRSDEGLTLHEQPLMTDYLGRSGRHRNVGSSSPEAFLVEFPPHGTVGAHFHSCNQFQVFLPAAGVTYQRTPVDTVVVHYADAYTTYGPFATKDLPLSYLTLRGVSSTLTAYMPGSRHLLRRRGRRNLHRALPDEALPDVGVSCIDLIAPDDDSLCCTAVSMAPHSSFELHDCPPTSGGRYLYVVRGAVGIGADSHPAGAIGWSDPGAPAVTTTASTEGAVVLVMQLPGELESEEQQ